MFWLVWDYSCSKLKEKYRNSNRKPCTSELLENKKNLRFGFVYTPGNQIIVQIKKSNANLVENYIQLVSKCYSFVICQAENTQGFFLYKKKTVLAEETILF